MVTAGKAKQKETLASKAGMSRETSTDELSSVTSVFTVKQEPECKNEEAGS